MTGQVTPRVYFLLVDDLEENLLSLDALLRRDGLVSLKAKSGREALELLLKHDVALALLDVQMPGMDGFELAELMRGTERTRQVPIIFVTAGHSDYQRRFRGYEAGAVDFIQKPIEPDILRSKAEVFFELYRQRAQVAMQRDELKIIADENDRLLKESRQYAEALKEADRRKDEFLAVLAHELRNPLAPIRNGLQIMRMAEDSKRDTSEIREMMERQLKHLVRLIDDLLDVSRVTQGKIDLRKQVIKVDTALQAAIEASRPLIDDGKHNLKVDIAPDDMWVDADLTRLAQIVSNLLNNAAKYTPEGGEITLSARLAGHQVAIAVSDNGMGIPPNMLPKVFELFTQVDRGLDRSQGGLGIGLALVKQLVGMHAGTIEASSGGIGKGSRFTIRLPLAHAPNESEDDQTIAPEAPKQLDVLVVDDNLESAKTIGWLLETMGHNTTIIHDGTQAIEFAKKLRPDVILLDIGLPGMNGYDVCRMLRQDSTFKDTVIIAQTGWGQQRDKNQAAEAGFNHHFLKPVNFEEFSKLLATIRPQTKAS